MFRNQIEELEYKLLELDSSIESLENEVKDIKKDRTLVRAGLKRMEGLQEQLVQETAVSYEE